MTLKLALILISLIFTAPTGHAHYNYPKECCSGLDCGEVITNIKNMEDGSRYITIKLVNKQYLSAIFPKDFPIMPSFDSRDHACIGWRGKPLCLFLTGVS